MRVVSASLILSLAALSGCATPVVVVPDAALLDPDGVADYREAFAALLDDRAADAADLIEPHLEREPWHVPSHVMWQDAQRAFGGEDATRARYAAWVLERPTDAARVLLSARVAPRRGDEREALYREARALDRDSAWPRIALTHELLRGAAEDRRRETALGDSGYPDEADAAAIRALAREDEAARLSARLVERWPDLADAHASAAAVHLAIAEDARRRERDRVASRELALRHAARASELDVGHPGRFVLLARVQRELANDVAAAAALEQALELDQDDPRLLASLGRVHLDLGDALSARDALARAVQGLPDDAIVRLNLGVARHRSGDLDGAAEALARAAELAPDDPRPYAALALVESERGRQREAVAAIERFLELGGRGLGLEDVSRSVR